MVGGDDAILKPTREWGRRIEIGYIYIYLGLGFITMRIIFNGAYGTTNEMSNGRVVAWLGVKGHHYFDPLR